MKLSELEYTDVADYLKIDDYDMTNDEIKLLKDMLKSAKSYIINYTGLTIEEADRYDDLTQVAFIICQDYHDNRSYYIEGNRSMLSKAVETTLGLYSVNLL